jgi:hypothetical protein
MLEVYHSLPTRDFTVFGYIFVEIYPGCGKIGGYSDHLLAQCGLLRGNCDSCSIRKIEGQPKDQLQLARLCRAARLL